MVANRKGNVVALKLVMWNLLRKSATYVDFESEATVSGWTLNSRIRLSCWMINKNNVLDDGHKCIISFHLYGLSQHSEGLCPSLVT